jgi:lipoprotein-anchoring transpeptidase ErfK/SrfK
MPHSVFFHGGYAIHGTYETRNLGLPVSHGCVRLHPQDAATFFAMVQEAGLANTRIIVVDN